ncbi:NECAP-like protein CG9132 [Sipha flava]|nr:NECAP-like protein CG9132 [Sipha flava]
METYESILLVKNEVFVFKIPPRTTNRGYRAADWNLAEPTWTGRMRIVSVGDACTLKLEDRNNGELFAKCPIDQYPGLAIESVSDSSRYFVVRIQDENGRAAFIGLGFGDRSDSFDLNVALQDHFKRIKVCEEIAKEKNEPKQELDLKFKEGETIKINMKITKKDGSEGINKQAKPRPISTGSGGLLPPPPGSSGTKTIPAPPSQTSSPSHQPTNSNNWGEFTSANNNSQSGGNSNPNWVQF